MLRCNCVANKLIALRPVDYRRVHRAGEHVCRKEHIAAAGWHLDRARGRGTDRSLRALSLPPHPPPSHRYTHHVHMLADKM